MTFPKPTAEDIINALNKTGFLLEQQTAKMLEAAEFITFTGKAFEDPEEGKSREIDCAGYRLVAENLHEKWHVLCRVIIECKNVNHPYIVVGRSPSTRERFRSPAEAWFTAPKIQEPLTDGRSGYTELPRWRGMGFEDLPHNPYRSNFVGDQLLPSSVAQQGVDGR